MPNKLILKWGTVKGWELETQEAVDALQKWANHGRTLSAAMQRDTPEQKKDLLAAIDFMDEIWLDWEDKKVSREEAKQYVMNYGKSKPAESGKGE